MGFVQPIVQRFVPIAQRSIAFGSIGASYTLIGTTFSSPLVLVIIISTLNQIVQFSWDGIVDAFPIPIASTVVLDLKSDGIAISTGSGAYVKQIDAPTSGNLYIGGFAV